MTIRWLLLPRALPASTSISRRPATLRTVRSDRIWYQAAFGSYAFEREHARATVDTPAVLRPEEILAKFSMPHFVSALYALSSKISGVHASRTIPRIRTRLAKITRIDLVTRITRRTG